jgi:excisionase family DNA binding protein
VKLVITCGARGNTGTDERDITDMNLGAQRVSVDVEPGPHRLPTGADLLTVAEVSNMLRVSKMTIYRMVHSGELTHVRVGRSFRIPTDAVRGILDNKAPGLRHA